VGERRSPFFGIPVGRCPLDLQNVFVLVYLLFQNVKLMLVGPLGKVAE
jgi:hypothetical protein